MPVMPVSEIKVLDGLEAVRKRPAMYIGSTSGRGVGHLLWEAVSNCIDEHLAGHATKVEIHHGADGSWRVADDGRGIDPDRLDTFFQVIHCGQPPPDDRTRILHGHGVGIVIVNALSSWMRVEVRRGGGIWQQLYVQGGKAGELTRIGTCDEDDTGTVVHYLPDLDIFTEKHSPFPTPETLAPRVREFAALASGLKITMQGVDYSSPEGLSTLTEQRAGSGIWGTTLTAQATINDIDIDVAVTWAADPLDEAMDPTNQFFVNYEDMVQTAPKMELMLAASRSEGRHAVVSLLMRDPQIGGATRQRFDDDQAIWAIRKLVKGALKDFLAEYPDLSAA